MPRPRDGILHPHSLRWYGLVLLLCMANPVHAWSPYAQRPNALDLMETGLYWMQDYTGRYDPRDPVSVVGLMEDQIGRFFDLTTISLRVAGPHYHSINLLQRSHFQNRLRDRLFEILALEFGWFDPRPPRVWMGGWARTGIRGWQFGFHVRRPALPSHRRIDFHVYYTPLGWRIHEVMINGVPMTAMLRY